MVHHHYFHPFVYLDNFLQTNVPLQVIAFENSEFAHHIENDWDCYLLLEYLLFLRFPVLQVDLSIHYDAKSLE